MADVTEPVEQSWPVEEKPLPGSQWSSITKGIGNGIIDQGGFPYRLVFPSDANATNQGVLRCPTIEDKQFGSAILEGFFHKYTADMVLDFPAVTATTTYYVVLRFDPVAVTEGGLPVSVDVVTSLDYTSGKNYLHLYNVRRQPNQLLTDAEVRMIRPRVAPVQVYTSYSDMPQAQKSLWGTLAIVHNGRSSYDAKLYMAMTGDDGESTTGWFWKPIFDPSLDTHAMNWEVREDASDWIWPGSGNRRMIGRLGKRREMRGRIRLTRDRTFESRADSYAIWGGNLDEADRPAGAQRFITATNSASGGTTATIEIATNGEVRCWVSAECTWVSFDGILWEVP